MSWRKAMGIFDPWDDDDDDEGDKLSGWGWDKADDDEGKDKSKDKFDSF